MSCSANYESILFSFRDLLMDHIPQYTTMMPCLWWERWWTIWFVPMYSNLSSCEGKQKDIENTSLVNSQTIKVDITLKTFVQLTANDTPGEQLCIWRVELQNSFRPYDIETSPFGLLYTLFNQTDAATTFPVHDMFLIYICNKISIKAI